MVSIGPAALTERVYVSQFSSPAFGLTIVKDGQPANADVLPTVTVVDEGASEEGEVIATLTAEQVQVGDYQIRLTSVHTQKPGFYTLKWDYTIDQEQEVFASYIEVGQASPAYDDLPEELKDLVDDVWVRFADLYDSPNGGPHVQAEIQAHFNRGRIAQLMRHALSRLNVKSQPKTTYTVEGGGGTKRFPLGKWGGLLEQATYIETIKHLRRTYVEQPEVIGVNIARVDRKDYLQRWGDILRDEQEDFDRSLEHFKIAHMGLGRPSVMVSGGVYGTYAPTRIAHSTAARPRYYARFY